MLRDLSPEMTAQRESCSCDPTDYLYNNRMTHSTCSLFKLTELCRPPQEDQTPAHIIGIQLAPTSGSRRANEFGTGSTSPGTHCAVGILRGDVYAYAANRSAKAFI